jgi:hypothetical protein
VVEQQPADDRPERDPGAARGGPEADRALPLVAVGERVGDDRQRRGHDQRSADAHARARRRQHPHRAGECRPRRAGRERDQAGEEGPLAPDPVGETAGDQQQAAKTST